MAIDDLQDHFLTQDDHMMFRTLTKLLADLENHKQRISYHLRRHSKPPTDKARKEKGRKIYEVCQEPHVNILVRDHENPTIVIGPTIPGKSGTGSIVFVHRSEAVMFHEKPKCLGLGWKEVGARALDMPHPSGSEEIDPIGLVIQSRINANQSGSSMPFHQHVEHYMQLLRNCHTADKSSFATAVENLRKYIYISSYPKMIRRLHLRGQNDRMNRNFFEILRCLPHDVPQQHHDLEVPPEFAGVRPTEQQREFFEDFWKRTQPRLDAPRLAKSKLYGKAGRRRFQEVLAVTLDEAKEALTDIRDAMGSASRDSESVLAQRDKIEGLVQYAYEAVRELLCLLDAFDDILIHHLKWLASISGVKGSRDIPLWANGENQTNGGSVPIDAGSSQAGGKRPQQDNDEVELDRLEKSEGGWPAAAKKYLHLICLHQSSLLRATSFSPVSKKTARKLETSQILNSSVAVVEIAPQANGNARLSFNEALEILGRGAPRLKVEKVAHWFEEHRGNGQSAQVQNPSSATTSGTVHAEATLLSLIAIAFNTQIMQQMPPEGLHRDGISITKESLIAMTNGASPLMHIAKPCCPACSHIIKSLSEKGPIDAQPPATTPDFHARWRETSLPPFLPRDIAESCLSYVEGEATTRLLQIQYQLEEDEWDQMMAEDTMHEQMDFLSTASSQDDPEDFWDGPPSSPKRVN